MSKRNRPRQYTHAPLERPMSPPSESVSPVQYRGSAQDTFQNWVGRLGLGMENPAGMAEYPLTRISRDYNLMNALYRNNWIAKKIINVIPEDMLKNWFSITAELTPEETDRYKKIERRTQLKEKLLEGLYWGRLYGGAGAVIMIDGDEDRLNEPLIVKDIMPHSFCGLLVLDRWSGIFPGMELITDIRDPDFGLPKYYEIRDVDKDKILQRVHNTRIIRFTGRKLP